MIYYVANDWYGGSENTKNCSGVSFRAVVYKTDFNYYILHLPYSVHVLLYQLRSRLCSLRRDFTIVYKEVQKLTARIFETASHAISGQRVLYSRPNISLFIHTYGFYTKKLKSHKCNKRTIGELNSPEITLNIFLFFFLKITRDFLFLRKFKIIKTIKKQKK